MQIRRGVVVENRIIDEVQLIYLSGYGRSGQTLLESILHGQEEIFVLGAIGNLPEILHTQCSCGEKLINCPFWSKALTDFQGKIPFSIEEFYRLRGLFEGIAHCKPYRLDFQSRERLQEQYVRYTRLFYQCIWDQTPKGTKYIVDATKTAYPFAKRPLQLHPIYADRLKVIHLIRDLRGVMWSMINKGLYLNRSDTGAVTHSRLAFLRALLGWKVANHFAASLPQKLPSVRYLQIKYEDLISFPAEVLTRIGAFLNMDFSILIDQLGEGLGQEGKHSVMGNPMRFQAKVRLKPDLAWQTKLPSQYRAVCQLFAGRQMAAYGYPID